MTTINPGMKTERVAMNPVEEWKAFSDQMEEHITEMGKKYTLGDNGIQYYQLAPWQWALGDAGKYVFEIMPYANDPELMSKSVPKQMVRENLLKAIHTLQIAYTKLERL